MGGRSNWRRPSTAKGFTLLEIMLVLLIIGLMTGVGIALLGDSREQRQRAELQGLAEEFQLAGRIARHGGQIIGWHLQDGHYRYLRLRATTQGPRWSPLDSDMLGDGALPPGVRYLSPPSAAPQLAWWPTGESQGARLAFAGETQGYLLSVDRLGRPTLEVR